MADRVYRHLHLVGAASSILRTTMFNDTEHLVVPVVMMVEGVVWAINSEYPELVLAEELAVSPQQWDGRQCFAGHPEDNGTQVTANTPEILQTSFGYLFHADSPARILTSRQLGVEAYLDPVKAAKLGDKAVSVIERLRAGKTVEISCGAYVVAEATEGIWAPTGQPYVGIWREIVSDHLAFLGEDEVGACSVAAGCGAARQAIRHLVTAKGITAMPDRPSPSPPPPSPPSNPSPTPSAPPPGTSTPNPSVPSMSSQGWIKKMLSLIRRESADLRTATPDTELRRKLYSALNTDVPAFIDILEVDPAEGTVIYYANPDNEWKMFRRGFSEMASGDVKLKVKIEEVEEQTDYVVVGRAAKDGACGCGANKPTSTGEEITMRDATKTFIASSKGKFTDADAKWLDAIPEDKLPSLVAKEDEVKPVTPPAATTTATTETPAAEVQPKAAVAKEQTEEDWMKTAPKSVRERFAAMQAQDDEEKAELVEGLKAAQEGFTEDELKKFDLAFLRKLAKSAKINDEHDFSGRALPRALVANDPKDVYANPPDPYAPGLRAMRGEQEPKATVN